MDEPRAERAHLPGYGLPETAAPLPWSWAEERLVAARRYWVVTVWPDGTRPHAMPVWGLWHDRALWFSTGARSRKARNLAANPRCVVHTDDGVEPVVVEGAAERVPAGEAAAALARYEQKYGMAPPAGEPVVRVRPRLVLAMGEQPELFERATRWRF